MEHPESILLDRYLKAGDHAAFTELVRRHLPLVHAASLRVTRNAALAEEAAQLVFTRLAGLRSAPAVPLIVWLHRTTRSVSLNLIRAESRRRKWESLAASASAMPASSSPWERISPVLDEVIDELAGSDRHLVLARFFQGESHAALARALGLSEDAARMRVNRALEKLRSRLEKRGITTTATALGLALPAHAASSLGPALFLSVSQTALATAAAASTATFSLSTLTLILMTKKSALIGGAAALLLIGTGAVALQSTTPAASAAASGTPAPPRPVASAGETRLSPATSTAAAATEDASSRKASMRRPLMTPEVIRTSGLPMDISADMIIAKDREFNEARVELRLASLTRALNLTPAQGEALRKSLARIALLEGPAAVSFSDPDDSDAAEFHTVTAGNLARQPLFSLADDSPALEELRGQLSGPQQVALDQLRQQEKEQSVRMKAQSDLLELQQMMTLESGQEQQLSDLLAAQYRSGAATGQAGDSEEAKEAALKEILSPQQMAVYRKSRERLSPTVLRTTFMMSPDAGDSGK